MSLKPNDNPTAWTRYRVPKDAIEVARAFFALAKAEGHADFTAKKLQKLLYYAEAKSQADRGQSLFMEAVRAWDQGPVVAAIWKMTEGMKRIPFTHAELDKPAKLSDADRRLVMVVWERLKHLTGDDLSEMTHAPGGAWDRARNRRWLGGIFVRNPIIKPADMTADIHSSRQSEAALFDAFIAELQATQ